MDLMMMATGMLMTSGAMTSGPNREIVTRVMRMVMVPTLLEL